MTTTVESIDRLRILLVADRHLVGEAVRMALASRGDRAASMAFPESRGRMRETLRRIRDFDPQVAVLLADTVEDPGRRGRLLRLIEHTRVAWLLLTDGDDARQWGAVIEAGAAGILPMTATLDQLHEALVILAGGSELLTASERERIVDDWRQDLEQKRQLAARLALLTPRESAVLESLAVGRSVREIADHWGVAEGTVRSQMKAVRRKLRVGSQLAAVAAFRSVGAGAGGPPPGQPVKTATGRASPSRGP